MAICEWWDDSQIYWDEVTDRSDLGSMLVHAGKGSSGTAMVSRAPGGLEDHGGAAESVRAARSPSR